MGFQFGEGLFEWIEVWGTLRHDEAPTAVTVKRLCGFQVAMGREVVENDDDAPRNL